MNMQNTQTETRKQSESLSAREWAKYKKKYDSYRVKQDFSEATGLTRFILERVYLKGSASPENIAIIKKFI